jgi:hypothetical protein
MANLVRYGKENQLESCEESIDFELFSPITFLSWKKGVKLDS